jgi:hypothetical protein
VSISLATRGVICIDGASMSLATRGAICLPFEVILAPFVPTFVIPTLPIIVSEIYNKPPPPVFVTKPILAIPANPRILSKKPAQLVGQTKLSLVDVKGGPVYNKKDPDIYNKDSGPVYNKKDPKVYNKPDK